jgi:hypothetical protein
VQDDGLGKHDLAPVVTHRPASRLSKTQIGILAVQAPGQCVGIWHERYL